MRPIVAAVILWIVTPSIAAQAQFTDTSFDANALPKVPDGFEVSLFAREPLVQQPCSMAFDAQGRLFVGMGPQYRNPTPETPGDSVVIVLDTDGDGVADRTKAFATGFNAVQGLAWHGRDLWVANAPDLTVVRDLDGDDEADEYVRLYTDLGNLEHGLHGLNWAPDGKLYMSKGNSKGLNRPGRYSPKPFRDLWGMSAPKGTPDFPEPQRFGKHEYKHAYHDPADDWGLCGGVLRCDDGGHNLEIVSRGFRNPWDITMDSGFHWLGTDNDQIQGDRVFMPFDGAHFGWNHPWDAEWTDRPDAPTAPVSGPLFEGSGTGLIFYDSPKFPEKYRRVFFINDWLSKTTFVWRPEWDGALMRPAGGEWEPFVEGGTSLYRPTDIEIGPDGALWVLGWSSGYGAEWKDEKLTNEGRIFRISWKHSPALQAMPSQGPNLEERSVSQLVDEFAKPLPIWKSNAQDELVRRGRAVKSALMAELRGKRLSEMQETWAAWTLGRLDVNDANIETFFVEALSSGSTGVNVRIQSLRILAHRIRERASGDHLPAILKTMLRHEEPRLRFAAVQAVREARDQELLPDLLTVLSDEKDRLTYYAGWQTLRVLTQQEELRGLLQDPRAGVRRGAFLGLLESDSLSQPEVARLSNDSDARVSGVARQWLSKVSGGDQGPLVKGPPLRAPVRATKLPSGNVVSVIRNVAAHSDRDYRVVGGGLTAGVAAYSDRTYRLKLVPHEVHGADLIQTANDDDGSRGDDWLNFELLLPALVFVAVDTRMNMPPRWVRDDFKPTKLSIATDDCELKLYSREFSAGRVQLGGNTDDGKSGGKSNYVIAVQPLPLAHRGQAVSTEEAMALLNRADVPRGEILFKHQGGAGCFKCHSLDATRDGFGPNLREIGQRANAKHIVQSILQPSAVITEGFTRQVVLTDDARVCSGILLNESGLSLTLGLATGERLTILKKHIEERRTDRVSAMPSVAELLTAQQVADITGFLLTQRSAVSPPKSSTDPAERPGRFQLTEKPDRIVITHSGKPVADYVFRDARILRPYFANVHGPNDIQVTRRHPPVKGKDATDHATMHPGIWFGFGDISGVDFWRNKGRIEHVRFLQKPTVTDRRLTFTTLSKLVTPEDSTLCEMTSRIMLVEQPGGWLLVWDAAFRSNDRDIKFGDQEEMGFGARVATSLAEKNGGVITSSSGLRTAARTWGQAADWCDYTGLVGKTPVGITLMASPDNFRQSWWHNRDYGVFVANPFGRAAMRQGERSAVTVPRGQSFRVRFGAFAHNSPAHNPANTYRVFLKLLHESPKRQ
ncbi:MAG: hypothetical protein CMJ48_05380 [Planctomycetaceae bacterium]|nr:hypothetical protein [Planctomycetaceae bacterium]